MEYGIFIDGKWQGAEGKGRIETINPTTGEVLAAFPQGTRGDAQRAIDAAERAFPRWRAMPPAKRGEVLLQAARLLRQRKQELGELVSREMGKVIAEGKGEVQEAIDFLEYIAGEGRRLLGETVATELPDKFAMTIRLPVGVVGVITPWNFPIAVPSWKIGAALVCGNPVVWKPASTTPLVAARFTEVLNEAGLPPGVINMVTGSGREVGDAIVNDPRVRVISFTGSVETGREIYSKASKRLARVGLELGGKNPIVVMDDAKVDLVLEGVLFGAFGTAGQRCTAASRLIIHQAIYDRVVGELVKRTKALRLGDPLDPSVDVGPVHSDDQKKKILEYIEIGKKEGARLLCGGRATEVRGLTKGLFVEPTIFEAAPTMRIAREEIFGPVLAVLKARDYGEAIAIANGVEYGLSSSIYTQDINTAFRAMGEMEAGITYVNAPTIGAEVQLPFGGVKNTGVGTREAGTEAIEEFTEIKAVYVDYSGRLQKAQIQDERVGKQAAKDRA